jgi:hypothetical protein
MPWVRSASPWTSMQAPSTEPRVCKHSNQSRYCFSPHTQYKFDWVASMTKKDILRTANFTYRKVLNEDTSLVLEA